MMKTCMENKRTSNFTMQEDAFLKFNPNTWIIKNSNHDYFLEMCKLYFGFWDLHYKWACTFMEKYPFQFLDFCIQCIWRYNYYMCTINCTNTFWKLGNIIKLLYWSISVKVYGQFINVGLNNANSTNINTEQQKSIIR